MVLERETTDALERWCGAPLHPGFRERFAVRAVLSTPFRGAQAGGRLFWLDRPGLNSDDLVLAQVVAVQVAPLLDQVVLQRRLREAAVDHERVRLARDLHDGLLQSLAAMSLRIQAARDLGRTDPPAACARLGDLQQALSAEQRGLRLFIRQLRGGVPRGGGVEAPLEERLRRRAPAEPRL